MTGFLLALILGQGGAPAHNIDAQGKKAGHAVTAPTVRKARLSAGKPAPEFKAQDTDGRTVTLKGLTAKPTLLVFMKKGCPCCDGGRRYIDRICRDYGDVATIAYVVDANRKESAKWKRANGPACIVLADPQGVVAKAYAAEAGLATRLVDTQGRVVRSYPGYSAPMLREISATLANLAKVADRKVETYPAPEAMTSGCPLPQR